MKDKLTPAMYDAIKAGLIAAYDNHGYDVRSVLTRIAHEVARDRTQPQGLRDIMGWLTIAGCKTDFGREPDGRRSRARAENTQLTRLQNVPQ